MKVYKIIAYEKGEYKWLFHGNFGTRNIKLGEWLDCQIREKARDGKGTYYKSGFHTIENLEELKLYMNRFKNKDRLRLAECEIGGEIWEKEHSPYPVLLSSKIKVIKILED